MVRTLTRGDLQTSLRALTKFFVVGQSDLQYMQSTYRSPLVRRRTFVQSVHRRLTQACGSRPPVLTFFVLVCPSLPPPTKSRRRSPMRNRYGIVQESASLSRLHRARIPYRSCCTQPLHSLSSKLTFRTAYISVGHILKSPGVTRPFSTISYGSL